MPTPQEVQIRRMCTHDETIRRAQALLNAMSARTGPGSGYDIGQGTLGLPAICAYLASEQLANDDVTEKTAQSVSCLAPKIFRTTLATVRAALAAAQVSAAESTPSTPQRRRAVRQSAVTYPTLLANHKVLLADTVLGWLEDTERMLDSAAEFRASYDANTVVVKCAVFYWVAQILGLTRIKRSGMLESYDLQDVVFADVCSLLDKHGAAKRQAIADEIVNMKKKPKKPKGKAAAPVRTGSTDSALSEPAPSQSSSTLPLSAPSSEYEVDTDSEMHVPLSPRKSALKRPPVPKTPQTPRRTVKFRNNDLYSITDADDALPLLEDGRTPRKRLKFPSIADSESDTAGRAKEDETPRRPSRKATPTDASTTSRGKRGSRSPSKSPSKSSHHRKSPSPLPSAQSDEGSDENDHVPPPRRYRPIFADRQQWLAPDPRAEREWAATKRAAVKAEEMWGYPFARERHGIAMEVDA